MRIASESAGNANKFIILETVTYGLIVLTTMLKIEALSSLLFSLTFLLVFAQLFSAVRRGISRLGVAALLISVSALLCVCINAFVKGAVVSFSYFREALIFICTILYLYLVSDTAVGQSTINLVLKGNVLISLLYPIAYFFFSYEDLPIGLSLNFSNPNLAALWLLLSIFYCVLAFMYLQSAWRLIAVGAGAFNIYLMVLTRSRNTLLALILFAVIFSLSHFKRGFRYSNVFLWIMDLLPAVFVPVYMYVIRPIIDKGWLDFLVSTGKPLDSRIPIWERCFEGLKGCWLTGNYAELRGNAHNLDMVLLCSYGVLLLLIVTPFLFYVMRKANRSANNRFRLYCISAFFAVLFMGIGEGMLFSGGQGIFLPACGYLLLANNAELPQKKERRRLRRRG